MPRIDAHQHFWKFNPVRDNWITEEMSVIRRNFLPADLAPLLEENGIDGCVTVQSDQSETDNILQLANDEAYSFIRGVVGWVDLQDVNIDDRLMHYSRFSRMKGFRHVLQGEKDRALMLRPAFKNGIGFLRKYGFTYDILIYPDQLRYAGELAATFPDQLFVIDHIAKPYIKEGKITEWKKDMQAIAAHRNVYCKMSGMVTEADWKNWKVDDLRPYMDAVVEAFGVDRIMFGSDWPVCLVAANYSTMLSVVSDYFAAFSRDEQSLFFGGNAIKFYKL
jgi:L-fuconolactonase